MPCNKTHTREFAMDVGRELETPTQYVGNNLDFLAEAFTQIRVALDKYGELVQAIGRGRVSRELAAEAGALRELLDLDFLDREIPLAVRQSREGVDRIAAFIRGAHQHGWNRESAG